MPTTLRTDAHEPDCIRRQPCQLQDPGQRLLDHADPLRGVGRLDDHGHPGQRRIEKPERPHPAVFV